jgi:hypothetical protein
MVPEPPRWVVPIMRCRLRGRPGSRRRLLGLTAVTVAATFLTGCATLQQPEVEQVATAFATGDAATRCALLAPATLAALQTSAGAPCGEAVASAAPAGGQVVHTEVWGDDAQVHLADDTLFLIRTSAGWRVSAAGCTPDGDAPYQCRVEGP